MTTAADVRERPVIFSARMVEAILKHQKTQTRRLLKPQPAPTDALAGLLTEYDRGRVLAMTKEGLWVASPYGAPGDRLWIRERFTLMAVPPEMKGAVQLKRGPLMTAETADKYGRPDLIGWQLAAYFDGDEHPGGWPELLRRVSSIHMPRWAARVVLEVTRTRAERLHRMSVEDAIAEGVSGLGTDWLRLNFPEYDRAYADYLTRDAVALARNEPISGEFGAPIRRAAPPVGPDLVSRYARLWDTLNPAHPWATRPYVWVVSFRPVESERPT